MMKVGELRSHLNTLKKEDIIKIASEFYKLIPKEKKNNADFQGFIQNPNKTIRKNISKKQSTSLDELEIDIAAFIENARNQYYLIPNSVIHKKERSKWRFKVKKWYKELTNTKRFDTNLELQSKLLIDLYQVLCEACGVYYFSTENPFQSIGIEQPEYYASMITLLQKNKGKFDSIKQSIDLIINNEVDFNTLRSELMSKLLDTLDTTDSKLHAISNIEELLKKLKRESTEKGNNKKNKNLYKDYHLQNKINDLAKLGLMLYIELFEYEKGIQFFKLNIEGNDDEINLYILIKEMLDYKLKDLILLEIQQAKQRGIKLRQSLLDLEESILKTDQLPKYL